MQSYSNLGGDSGIIGFHIDGDSIIVYFNDGASYLYNYEVTGRDNVEHMKVLAKAGQGLNSFINRNIRKAYAAKLS